MDALVAEKLFQKPKRKYEPVWEEIKSSGKVILEVRPELAERVRKAVIREKYHDLGFKVLNDHDYFFLDISYNAATRRMHFSLRQRLGLEGRKDL